MSVIKIIKPSTEAEKATETTLDCWEIDCELLRGLKLPPFQRGLRVNTKVTDLAAVMAKEITAKGSTVIDGVFCIGLFNGERWLVDGQHRRQAFFMADEIVKERDRRAAATGYVDVRIVHFKTMREMAQEFVKLNSRLVNMKPDDILRGLEEDYEALAKIRRSCPFVGYDNIRRGEKSPMISMAQVVRCWNASSSEVPRPGGLSAADALDALSTESADQLISFLRCTFTAWGRDTGCYRLWGGPKFRDLHVALPADRAQRLQHQDDEDRRHPVHEVSDELGRRRGLRRMAARTQLEPAGHVAGVREDQGTLRGADRERHRGTAQTAAAGMGR